MSPHTWASCISSSATGRGSSTRNMASAQVTVTTLLGPSRTSLHRWSIKKWGLAVFRKI